MSARLHFSKLSLPACLLLVTQALCGQQGNPPTGLTGQPPVPNRVVPPQNGPPQSGEPAYRDVLDPLWVRPDPGPVFQGFPIFPSRLFGYGNYPGDGSKGAAGVPRLPLLTPAAPEEPGWPAWIRARNKEPLPFAADIGLLIRHSDRVWWRPKDEPAFVPLFHYDRFKALTAGAEIEVRQQGAFELLLHDSTRLVTAGPIRLRLVELTETDVRVEVPSVTRLAITANGRAHTFVLPDGSELRVPVPAVDEVAMGPAMVLIDRADEPGALGGRATISNQGRRPVLWHHATGDVTLAPDERITFFLSPPQRAVLMPLEAEGVALEPAAGERRGRSLTGGEVRWCGARFQLPAGASLRLESLQGDAFSPPAGKSGP